MMKRYLSALWLMMNMLTGAPGLFDPDHANAQDALPRIVIGLVVDQMRWDYLYRFRNRYGAGGFRRLLGEVCEL